MRASEGKRGRGYQRGAHVFAERNGVLYAYLPGPPPRRVSLHTRDHAEAQRAFAALLNSDHLGQAVDEHELVECARRWLEAPHGWTRRTLQTARVRIKAVGTLLAARGVVYPRDVSASILDAWLSERRTKITHRTLNRDLRTLRLCVAWAAERGFCAVNEALATREGLREAHRTIRRELPDPAEVARVLSRLDAYDAGGDKRRRGRSSGAIARALYVTGMRVDELRRLTVGDVHDGAVWVRPEEGAAATSEPTKSHRERRIPLAPEGLEVVRAYLCAVEGKARAWSESWLNRRLDDACTASGVPPPAYRRSIHTTCGAQPRRSGTARASRSDASRAGSGTAIYRRPSCTSARTGAITTWSHRRLAAWLRHPSRLCGVSAKRLDTRAKTCGILQPRRAPRQTIPPVKSLRPRHESNVRPTL